MPSEIGGYLSAGLNVYRYSIKWFEPLKLDGRTEETMDLVASCLTEEAVVGAMRLLSGK
jgi:hypothetical protein